MSQFSVYRNPNADTREAFPLLLDVQSDLIAGLGTRVVVPLCPVSVMKGKLIETLTPVVEVAGKQYAVLTPQLAGIPGKALGTRVADLAPARDAIVAALDMLITGI